MESKKDVKPNTAESFEERFKRMSSEYAAAREKDRQERSSRRAERAASAEERKSGGKAAAVSVSGDSVAIYKNHHVVSNYDKKIRSEGAIKRTARLIKGLKAAKAEADATLCCTAETRRAMYSAVFHDAWAPVCNTIENAADTLWGFLSSLGYDIYEILVFIANFFIRAWYYLGSVALFIWDKLWDFRLWADVHKRGIFQIFASTVSVIAIGLITISSMSAYEYSYYGRKLGIAKSTQEVYDVIELLGDKLSENVGASVDLDVERDIQFEKIYGFGLKIDNHDDILNTFTYMKDIRVEACAIFINGEQVAIVNQEETANQIIEKVRNHFIIKKEGYTFDTPEIREDIYIKEVNAVLADISNPDQVERLIETGSVKPVEPGKEEPMVTVSMTGTYTYTEKIAYGVRYVRNNNMYMGDISLVTAGTYGIKETKALVQFENGVEVSRVDQGSRVVSNPVDAVYYMGTKAIPERSGTGTWIFPLKPGYTVTSRFGYRNTGIPGATTNHKGVDLSCPMGTKIYAADGGVVTFSGRRGNLGLCVIINHGGLYETVYGHCSSLLVKIGDEVYQGQNIALVGRTGVASGPHLHFEVHYNGVPFDPLSLFK